MLAVAAFCCFLFFGYALSSLLFADLSLRKRLTFACALALLANMWMPALFSFVLGFTVLSQLLAAVLALLSGAGILLWRRRKPALSKPEKDGGWKPWLCCVLPAFLFSAVLLYTHTLLPSESGALTTGQSTYGDMSMHLGFITSISEQTVFPPYYSILPGTPVGYPFLCDAVSSTYYTLGLPLRTAYMLPSVWALFCVFSSAYLLFEAWLKDNRKAVMGFVLFFVGAGFGFLYFLPQNGDWSNFTRIFTAFYETPTNYVEENIRWVNPIADLLIPQRATLYGWAVLFPCLYLLYRAAFEGRRRYFPLLGVMAGLLPLIHTHSFLALALISAVLLFFRVAHERKQNGFWPALKPWLLYAGIAAAIALPQLFCFTFRQSNNEGFLRFGFNWANEGDFYFAFYIKNIGIPYLMILPAFLLSSRETKQWYAGGLLILLLSEILIFQPNPYDNNKLLYIWHLMTCGMVGGFFVDAFDYLKEHRVFRAAGAAILLFVCCIGGVLTLGRELVSEYELFSPQEVRAAEFVKEDTAPDSIFLTANNHDNFVAALTGRNIVCGSWSYLYYHGLDYGDEEQSLKTLYETPTLLGLRLANVDYVLISSHERSTYRVDEAWFEENCELIYQDTGLLIYRVPSN